jgi:hypothetical protein
MNIKGQVISTDAYVWFGISNTFRCEHTYPTKNQEEHVLGEQGEYELLPHTLQRIHQTLGVFRLLLRIHEIHHKPAFWQRVDDNDD